MGDSFISGYSNVEIQTILNKYEFDHTYSYDGGSHDAH